MRISDCSIGRQALFGTLFAMAVPSLGRVPANQSKPTQGGKTGGP